MERSASGDLSEYGVNRLTCNADCTATLANTIAAQHKQIESIQHYPFYFTETLKEVEGRSALLVERDDLAINHGVAGQTGEPFYGGWELTCEIPLITRPESCNAAGLSTSSAKSI